MSTDYPVIDDGGDYELYLDESSSRVSLVALETDSEGEFPASHVLREGMDSRELARIGLVFLRVASYLDGNLQEALRDQDKYTVDELRRTLT